MTEARIARSPCFLPAFAEVTGPVRMSGPMPWGWNHRRRDARWLDGTVVGGAALSNLRGIDRPAGSTSFGFLDGRGSQWEQEAPLSASGGFVRKFWASADPDHPDNQKIGMQMLKVPKSRHYQQRSSHHVTVDERLVRSSETGSQTGRSRAVRCVAGACAVEARATQRIRRSLAFREGTGL